MLGQPRIQSPQRHDYRSHRYDPTTNTTSTSSKDHPTNGSHSKVGLVLGAGGVAGGAFHAGVLAALHDSLGWDPRRADVIVGTSAGSVTAASLRAGLSGADMLARAEGRPMSLSGTQLLQGFGPPLRPPPLDALGARPRPLGEIAATLARAAARPFSARPLALLVGLLPEGTVGTEFIVDGVAALHRDAWPTRTLWVCAVRQRDGRLVVFGRHMKAEVAQAVAASCAIPGFFRPVQIDGELYVDGGAHSPTNADLLSAEGPRLVVVSSPMSHAGSVRRSGIAPVRRWSRLLLDGESYRLRRAGVHVVAFQPTAEDITVMGHNSMDPSRRADIARQSYESTLRRLARADTRERLASIASSGH